MTSSSRSLFSHPYTAVDEAHKFTYEVVKLHDFQLLLYTRFFWVLSGKNASSWRRQQLSISLCFIHRLSVKRKCLINAPIRCTRRFCCITLAGHGIGTTQASILRLDQARLMVWNLLCVLRQLDSWAALAHACVFGGLATVWSTLSIC